MAIALSSITLSSITLKLVPNRVPSQSKIALSLSFYTRKQPSVLQGRVRLWASLRESQQITSIDQLSNGNKGRNNSNEGDAPERTLAKRWREIHGGNNWDKMLDPTLDPMLRSELIRYGEMAQACYNAYDAHDALKNRIKCKIPNKSRFFEELGMAGHGYSISRYLTASSNIGLHQWFKKSEWIENWIEVANWIGYVAVSNDETSQRLGRRDITIAWRGTSTNIEWIHDALDILKPLKDKIPCDDSSVKAELGFTNLYTGKDEHHSNLYVKDSLAEQIREEVSDLMNRYDGEELSITVTGHSLGAALAVLSAFDIAEKMNRDGSKDVPICVFSFSGPRVGNIPFKERLENELKVKVLRVYNVHDRVPTIPGKLINERFRWATNWLFKHLPWSYSHVGKELQLDHKKSPFLKQNVGSGTYLSRLIGLDLEYLRFAHNLEALLHLIDGYHGKEEKYIPGERRSLVNKDYLIADHNKPPNGTNLTSKSNDRGTP